MYDKLTPEQRSAVMGKIGGKNTSPEITVRRMLHRLGYRFRLHRRDLPGRPDIWLPRYRTAVFVHGCFWHGHRACKRATIPLTRREFWREKIERNRQRDARAQRALVEMGHRVLILWQCELRDETATAKKLDNALWKSSHND